jgi:hypothetical protein
LYFPPFLIKSAVEARTETDIGGNAGGNYILYVKTRHETTVFRNFIDPLKPEERHAVREDSRRLEAKERL